MPDRTKNGKDNKEQGHTNGTTTYQNMTQEKEIPSHFIVTHKHIYNTRTCGMWVCETHL